MADYGYTWLQAKVRDYALGFSCLLIQMFTILYFCLWFMNMHISYEYISKLVYCMDCRVESI